MAKIRVWKLGNLEHKIIPTAAACDVFAHLLEEAIAEGGGDIVWGPDVEVIEVELDDDDIDRVEAAKEEEPEPVSFQSLYLGLDGLPRCRPE